MGAKNDYDYEWLKTQDMYNNLLADLSTHNTENPDSVSAVRACMH